MDPTIKQRREQIETDFGSKVGGDFSILVKFNLSAKLLEACINAGVPKQQRGDDDVRDLARTMDTEMKGENANAFRKCVADTGVHVLQGDKVFAFAGSLHADLVSTGRQLASVEYFTKQRPGQHKPTGVLQCVYAPAESSEPVTMSASCASFMEDMFNKNCWQHVHVWDNRNVGNPYTVNLVARVPGTDRAQNNLRLIDGQWELLDR